MNTSSKLNFVQRFAARVMRPVVARQRRLAAARHSNLVADWKTALITIDSEVRQDLRKLIERTRDLARNDSMVERACLLMANGVVGPDGVRVQNKYRTKDGFDRETNRIVEVAIDDFFSKPEVTGRHSMIDVLRLTVRHLVVDGNAFWTIKRDRKYKHGIAVQLWDITRLAMEKNEIRSDGTEVRMGVEMDSDKRPIAYWRYKHNPYDSRSAAWGTAGTTNAEAERIPAEDVIHFAHLSEADQTLGLPMLTQGVLKLRMLGMYEEAAIVQARMAAQCGAVIETTVPEDSTQYTDIAAPAINWEAGMMLEPPPGKTVKPFQLSSGVERFGEVVKQLVRNFAGGMGFSGSTLGNNPEGLNLALIKWVTAEEREHIKGLQTYIINTGLKPLLDAWAAMATLVKTLKVSAAEVDTKFVPAFFPRRWSSLDPQGDINAFVTAMNNGVMDPETAVRLLGNDMDLESCVEGLRIRKDLMKAAGVEIFTVSGQAATGGQNNAPGTSGNPNAPEQAAA